MRKPNNKTDYKKIIKIVNTVAIGIIILLIILSIPLGIFFYGELPTYMHDDQIFIWD